MPSKINSGEEFGKEKTKTMNGLASHQKYLFLEIYDRMCFESFLENKNQPKPKKQPPWLPGTMSMTNPHREAGS